MPGPILDFFTEERSPLNRIFTIARNALRPDLQVRLLSGPDPVNLAGATVKFTMRPESGLSGGTISQAAAALFGDGSEGILSYGFASGDTAVEGTFFAQFSAAIASRSYYVPNNLTQRLKIDVGPDI